MNFFESQDVARRKTGRLVVLFICAVFAIIVLSYLVVAGVLVGTGTFGKSRGPTDWNLVTHPALMLAVGVGTLLVVGGGSMYKLAQLRAGGSVVAESLGGRRLNTATTDPTERKLLNVVEEMAIASGTPVPPVYYMDQETGINAFAAGFSPLDAVIGVTRGCAERLTRDELQGVIAHEFSHVFNGDMRLNIRLMGMLHGILIIGILGYFLLRSAFYVGGGRRSKEGGGGAMAIVGIGVGLMVVGFAGTFFGNWIKAAVSRQREYLADASAVQFTRSPDGIAGALKKIGGSARGAKISSPNAAQASHMFFGRAITSGINALFSTHPPLDDRIKRIDPAWDGKFVKSAAPPRGARAEPAHATRQQHAASGAVAMAAPLAAGASAAAPASTASVRTLIDQIGHPTPAHVAYARELLAAMPASLVEAAHEPFGARAVIFGLLIDSDPTPRARQLERLEQHADSAVRDELRRLFPEIERLDVRLRLTLMETAMPALAALTAGQYEVFRQNVVELCRADERLDLFEWCLQRIVLGQLDVRQGRARPPRVQYYSLDRLDDECSQLLSVLAYAGHPNAEYARVAFDTAAPILQLDGLRLLPLEQCGLDELDGALDRLATTSPRAKRALITACATCIVADRTVTINEAELLRAAAETLGCPMPPLLPGERRG